MNAVKYVEVNAQSFLSTFVSLLRDEHMMEELMNDEHYVLRISPNAIEFCYPDDSSFLPRS